MKFIGESERTLKKRICEHIRYTYTKKVKETASEHLNLP